MAPGGSPARRQAGAAPARYFCKRTSCVKRSKSTSVSEPYYATFGRLEPEISGMLASAVACARPIRLAGTISHYPDARRWGGCPPAPTYRGRGRKAPKYRRPYLGHVCPRPRSTGVVAHRPHGGAAAGPVAGLRGPWPAWNAREPGLTPDMPGAVLAMGDQTRQTHAGGAVCRLRAGRWARVRREAPATDGGGTDLPKPRRGFTGRNGRDDDAGTALRRGERGRPLRRPRRPRAERSLHAADRRTAQGSGHGPDLPARAVRDRSGEPVATQGDPGTNPGRGNGGGNRGRGRHRGRARALVRGTGPGRARLHGRPGADRVGPPSRGFDPRPAAGRDRDRAAQHDGGRPGRGTVGRQEARRWQLADPARVYLRRPPARGRVDLRSAP